MDVLIVLCFVVWVFLSIFGCCEMIVVFMFLKMLFIMIVFCGKKSLNGSWCLIRGILFVFF